MVEYVNTTHTLDMDNFRGVFVVLLGGMGLALILALGEWIMWRLRRPRVDVRPTADARPQICPLCSVKPTREKIPINEKSAIKFINVV